MFLECSLVNKSEILMLWESEDIKIFGNVLFWDCSSIKNSKLIRSFLKVIQLPQRIALCSCCTGYLYWVAQVYVLWVTNDAILTLKKTLLMQLQATWEADFWYAH